MSVFKHRSGEKGIALVVALLITAVVGLMTAALCYTMASYLRNLAMVREKNQGYYAAWAGSEEMRDYLWHNSCAPPNWCGLLASNPLDATYQNRTQQMVVSSTMNTSALTGYVWNLYMKDNNDGDSNYSVDDDGIILASVMATDPHQNTTTTVEAMFIFQANNNIYSQLGAGPEKTSSTQQSGSGVNSGNIVQSLN